MPIGAPKLYGIGFILKDRRSGEPLVGRKFRLLYKLGKAATKHEEPGVSGAEGKTQFLVFDEVVQVRIDVFNPVTKDHAKGGIVTASEPVSTPLADAKKYQEVEVWTPCSRCQPNVCYSPAGLEAAVCEALGVAAAPLPAGFSAVTREQWSKIVTAAKSVALESFTDVLNWSMARFGVNTPRRQRMFAAQVGEETGQFIYMEEIASGSAYEGRRKGLGNKEQGDGRRFKGRGFIQLTGRANYTAASSEFGVDLLQHPGMVAHCPFLAAGAAGYYWQQNNVNVPSDKLDVLAASIKVNGRDKKTGLPRGLEERKRLYELAKKAIPEPES